MAPDNLESFMQGGGKDVHVDDHIDGGGDTDYDEQKITRSHHHFQD